MIVVVSCADVAEAAAAKATISELRKTRHLVAGPALDVARGLLGFPDDDPTKNAGAKGGHAGAHRPLLASRRPARSIVSEF